ncbi:TraB family protein [Enterococcus faecalis EnGen0298]|uniref:TraB/GumN family protein n=1 Tax=Enterococcus faecalis TaxID=1351 RepID=UPI00032FD659|nr:TraB/GumN family protein [Enterococcus faecalis]EOI86958.1 TraB family protein [Enterococcus faecalis EnGen0298]
MEEDIVRLFYKGSEIILIGTSHISAESADLVRKTIQEENPDTICIEWDQKRYKKNIHPDEWDDTDIVKIIKNKQFPVFIFGVIYKLFQKKVSQDMNSLVGKEFVVAVDESKKLNIKFYLIDRDSSLTFKRAWRMLNFREKVKLPYAFGKIFEGAEETEEEVQNLLESENFEPVFEELKESYPNLWEVFVTERDDYLATKIQNTANGKTVAVLGKAHLKGVSDRLKNNQKSDLKKLEIIPPKKFGSKLLEWIVPGILLILLGVSFYQGTQVGIEQLLRWLLWNGGLAALFTIFALGHPLTVLTSLIFAPLATLLPMVSVGVFSAIVEATVRKPKVKDFQTMDLDLQSLKTIYKNRVLRVFLVFFLSSLGGLLGNIIGGLGIVKNLF